jgi:diphosphomevalonate decarboxylase
VTLGALATRTIVDLSDGPEDSFVLDGISQIGPALQRVSKMLDLVRAIAKSTKKASVVSVNAFPTASGLASSASGFAALAVAASRAYGIELDPRTLSILARRGSGSAARSIYGGFVRMHAGARNDGSDAYAEPVAGAKLEIVAAIAPAPGAKEKAVGSTEGMERTRQTSPFHDAWLDQVDRDLLFAERAIVGGDFNWLGQIAEANCLAMHANAMAARPGLIYFQPTTLLAIERVRKLRADGVPAFFTIDAGPHVVVFTQPDTLEVVRSALAEIPEIGKILTSTMGGPAGLVDDAASRTAG